MIELGLVHRELLALNLERLVLPLELDLLVLENVAQDIDGFLIRTQACPLNPKSLVRTGDIVR
jgi:hypothetical protein